MSTYSSIRAASAAGSRPASTMPDRARAPSAVNGSEMHGVSSVNGEHHRSDRRSPFRPGDSNMPGAHRPRESVDHVRRQDGTRSGSTGLSAAGAVRAKWNPQAKLIRTTSAPLAPRISEPSLASTLPDDLQPTPLGELSIEEQEHAILDDLLFVFMGFEGQYIHFQNSYAPSNEKLRLTGPGFEIGPGLDPSLRDLASSMLKMASHYMALEAFVENQSKDECGSVNHALCATMRKLLRDYLMLIAQLEHQLLTNEDFTLQFLSLHTKSTSHMMFQLYSVAQEILRRNSILEEDVDDLNDMDDVENLIESLREGNDADVGARKVCKGGSVLGLITKRLASMSGDPPTRTLLTMLLREASKPYMTMLNEWLHHGTIKDPHGEFLIKEQKSIRREGLEQDYTDEYWEKRYTLREPDVPPQLEAVKDKVLLAGKYLNVVRECGGADASKEVTDVPLTFEDPQFLDNVNAAYAHANASLLTLLITTHELPARLQSLKHYFFLDRSDFFSYFLELASSELRKSAKSVNTGKLQSLLDLVVHQPGSVAADDPYKDDVSISMNEMSLTNWLMRVVAVTGLDQDAANTNISSILATPAAQTVTDDKDLKGIDALVLDYSVPFPLSLVISRVTLTRYQLLFRYLLSLRHLETILVSSWTEHNKASVWRSRSKNPQVEAWKRKAWTLRARMICFVQQLLYFCTAEVIEPNWLGLMARLLPENDESMPEQPSQRRTVDQLMQDHVDFLATCLKECMLTNSKLLKINSKITYTCTAFAQHTSLSRYLSEAETDPSKLDKLVENLERYEQSFSRNLKILLDALNYLAATETVVFLSLCARLSMASERTAGSSGLGRG